jgi:hypothetical protein
MTGQPNIAAEIELKWGDGTYLFALGGKRRRRGAKEGFIDVAAFYGQGLAIGISPLEIGRMSLGEFLAAGQAYADIMDPNGAGKPPPSDDDFDDMLASARAIGFLNAEI